MEGAQAEVHIFHTKVCPVPFAVAVSSISFSFFSVCPTVWGKVYKPTVRHSRLPSNIQTLAAKIFFSGQFQ
jgi:hypothetical protein